MLYRSACIKNLTRIVVFNTTISNYGSPAYLRRER